MRANPLTGLNEWETRAVRDGDILWVLPPLPGDDGGSQVLATIAAVVLAIAAPYLAAAIGPSLGITTAIGTQTLAAGITIAGNLLISAFVPPPPVRAPTGAITSEPTYSFGRVGNQLRAGSQIPRIYGTIRKEPDLMSEPWSRYRFDYDDPEFGTDLVPPQIQTLNILLCVGLGEYRINELLQGDTTVWTAEGGFTGALGAFEMEIVRPGDALTLFPAVVETSPEVDNITLAPADPDPVASGAFVAVAAGFKTDLIYIDIVWPQGLYDTDSNGVFQIEHVGCDIQTQLIDDTGTALGDWVTRAPAGHMGVDNQPLRQTVEVKVPPGRYAVRVVRDTENVQTGPAGSSLTLWSALRARLITSQRFPDLTVIAISIDADQLSTSAALRWTVDATAILPYFDEAGDLTYGPTEAIEAAALDICRADYALDLDDARIDLDAFRSLAAIWRGRGNVCCTVAERETDAWSLLEGVLTCGRARPQFLGNLVTVVRDGPVAIPSGLITQADMVRGSFEVERVHFKRESPNAVTMRFRNRQGDMESVECVPPGIEAVRSAEITNQFIVDRQQTYEEGCYAAATNNHRRRFPKWTMLAEGRNLIRGRLYTVSHPRPDYGRPGRVVRLDWPFLTLSAPHALAAGQPGWMTLRQPNGGYWGPVKVAGTGYDDTVRIDEVDFEAIIAGEPSGAIYSFDAREWIVTEEQADAEIRLASGNRRAQVEPTRASIGTDARRELRVKIVEVLPRADGQTEVLAVEEVDAVHTADQGTAPPRIKSVPAAISDPRSWPILITRQGPFRKPEEPPENRRWYQVTANVSPLPDAVEHVVRFAFGDLPPEQYQDVIYAPGPGPYPESIRFETPYFENDDWIKQEGVITFARFMVNGVLIDGPKRFYIYDELSGMFYREVSAIGRGFVIEIA